MEQLSGLDARFIYGETPTVHMHTLKIALVDVREVTGGYTFDRFREVLASRLDRLPAFCFRLVEIPFHLTHPVWADDPDFLLDRHLRRRVAAEPGGRRELDALVGEIASSPLDRRRPLWEITAVEGLADGRVAFVAKVHHALADGMTAVMLMQHVLDAALHAPSAPDDRDALAPRVAAPLPDRAALLRLAARSWARAIVRLPALLVRSLVGIRRRARHIKRSRVRTPRPLLDPPRAMCNGSVSARRVFATTDLSLSDVRAVKDEFDVSLNDVVLSLVGGALRRTLAEMGDLPTRPLVAGVPTGTHRANGRPFGNHVANLFTTLATDEADPVTRLQRVHAVTAEAKARHDALGDDLFEEWGDFTPPRLFTWTVRLWGRSRLANHLRPPINLVVSNVPGPRDRLSVEGAHLDAIYSVGPLLEGIGLNVTVWSYCDTLFASILGCPDLGPDVERVAEHLHDELAVLRDARTVRALAGAP